MNSYPRVPVTILALTLNEIVGVKEILPKIKKEWYDRLIVLDGGSTDGTIEWAQSNGYETFVQKRRGIRFAYLDVLPILQEGIILSLSPDGNCDPDKIPLILKKMNEGYDLVIGSRYLGDASSQDDDLITGFGNWLFTGTVNFLYRAKFTDAMVIYRAFPLKLIYELNLEKEESYLLVEKLFSTIISWEPLMSIRAAREGKRIGEIPAGEPARIGGVRKLQILRWGAAYYTQFFLETKWAKKIRNVLRLGWPKLEKIEGELVGIQHGRSFLDGEYFDSLTFVGSGKFKKALRVFAPAKLVSSLRIGLRGTFCFWNGHLYSVKPEAGNFFVAIHEARKSYLTRDHWVHLFLLLTVLCAPFSIWVFLRRAWHYGSPAQMKAFSNDLPQSGHNVLQNHS